MTVKLQKAPGCSRRAQSDALIWKNVVTFWLVLHDCATDKAKGMYERLAMLCSLTDRCQIKVPPLSSELSVIPQIQSRITSEKIKIIQVIQKSGLQQYEVDGPFGNKQSYRGGQSFLYHLYAAINGETTELWEWGRSAKRNWERKCK